jgi:hypothetical protein
VVAEPVWRLSQLSAPELTPVTPHTRLVSPSVPVTPTDHVGALAPGISNPAWASARA